MGSSSLLLVSVLGLISGYCPLPPYIYLVLLNSEISRLVQSRITLRIHLPIQVLLPHERRVSESGLIIISVTCVGFTFIFGFILPYPNFCLRSFVWYPYTQRFRG